MATGRPDIAFSRRHWKDASAIKKRTRTCQCRPDSANTHGFTDNNGKMRPSPARLIFLLVVLGCLATAYGLRLSQVQRGSPQRSGSSSDVTAAADASLRDYLALEAREKAAEQSAWSTEMEAERHEDELVMLWDSLNAARDPWTALTNFAPQTVTLAEFTRPEMLPHGIQRWHSAATAPAELDFAGWCGRLRQWQQAGWSLGRTTWRMSRFVPATGPAPARSVVRVTAELANDTGRQRLLVRAELAITWTTSANGLAPHPLQVKVQHAELLRRDGPPAFTPWLDTDLGPGAPDFPDPLIAADLDGDGLSELLLVGANRVWRNQPAAGGSLGAPRQFTPEPLAQLPPQRIVAAALADVDGDGRADLVFAGAGGLDWIAGAPGGFPGAVQHGWAGLAGLKHPQVLAIGDVDGDGHLDVWLAQYKLPYQGGQFPTPYFDANDGFPAHLLLNDGHGHFHDATESSGLAPKRFRRTYGASFIDLDGDGDLDLVNVSDFAGLDVYLNDGHGHFTDVTAKLGDTRHAFGMGLVFADFNGDARPDLLMLGMDSVLAERLDDMGLGRPEWPQHNAKRTPMTFGNRLFFGADGGLGLVPAPEALARALAHTGWSWGAALADFDNDRDLDLAVANGHETRPSTRDYERQFWLHDIHVAASTNNPAAELYFRTAAGRRQADGASYGGWQDNAFLLNCGGEDFPEVAWLLGLSVPADCHNLLADDLDGDGRLDLIVTTYERWPAKRQRLLVFHNELPLTNNWIGFRLDDGGRMPIGTKVELEDNAGRQTRWITVGDSYRSQSAATAHFGLGTNLPRRVVVRWPDGRQTEIVKPVANHWHRLTSEHFDGTTKEPGN